MKNFFLTFLIFLLILITSFIKNSTKIVDEKIFVLNENIFDLNNQLEDLKLEFNYLSSSERLMDFQKIHFENELNEKKISEFEKIDLSKERISIQKIVITKENE
tara:strand:+ start:57 stop:368 length:312 start_codon:yes stop_codon:yes gene_type:complete